LEFVHSHYETLKSINKDSQQWVGGKLLPYAQSVTDGRYQCQFALLPNRSVDRKFLFNMASSNDANTFTCCVAILGWGGMRRDHARSVLLTSEAWLPIAQAIRTQALGRQEAYSRFMHARNAKQLKGMGPAFFTKLIYFLGKDAPERGYIMDQWTALSANLLTGRKMVDLHILKGGFRVSDKNDPNVYDEFCRFIENLALDLKVSPDDAEMRIFSVGGSSSKIGEWRAYLKGNTF
jgi:hypothetical protein